MEFCIFYTLRLGHFNKTKFIEDEIQNCKKIKDKVKEYEDQRQVQGMTKKEALVKYFGESFLTRLVLVTDVGDKIHF